MSNAKGMIVTMKRLFCLVLCIILAFTILSGCSRQPGDEDVPETGADSITTPPDADIPVTAQIHTLTQGNAEIQYVEVSGLPNPDVQAELNDMLYTFFVWPLADIENPDKVITTMAVYDFIGVRYISVRAYEAERIEYDIYPVNSLRSIVLDLETGGYAGNAGDFIEFGYDLIEVLESDVFFQVHPEEPLEGGNELFTDTFVRVPDTEKWFYLTQDSFGIYVSVSHAEGGFWAFEAEYGAIKPFLAQRLIDATGLD